MEKLGSALMGPLCLVIALCGVALLLGHDPWAVATVLGLTLPVAAYAVFSVYTVIWAIKIGEIGAKQDASLQAKIFYWHGVSVILTIVLAAAGSFVVLFASLIASLMIGGLLSGTPR